MSRSPDDNHLLIERSAVASLYLHGGRRQLHALELSDGMDDLFTNGLERIVIPGSRDFLHVEQPEISQTTSWAV